MQKQNTPLNSIYSMIAILWKLLLLMEKDLKEICIREKNFFVRVMDCGSFLNIIL